MALYARAVRFSLQRICLAPVSFQCSTHTICRLGLEFGLTGSNAVSKRTTNVSWFNYSIETCICLCGYISHGLIS